MRRRVLGLVLAFVSWAGALAAAAGPPAAPASAPASARLPEESVSLEAGFSRALALAQPGQDVAAPAWPVAPGVRSPLVLTRHDVYAPDARIVAIDQGREIEVPRSRLRFFWGETDDERRTPVLVVLDPDTGAVEGTSWYGPAAYRLSRDGAAEGRYRIARSEEDLASPRWSCGQEGLSLAAPPLEPRRNAVKAPMLTGSYTAVIVVDTDNEFMQIKFANNTTAAANYIATLIATMNSQTYNPDFTSLTLVQGYTVLRPSTTPDPWTGGGGAADGAKLNEFTSYWSSNYGFVTRALAMLLSGKETDGGASGIAWIGGLCSTGFGYSVNQVFTGGDFFSTIGQLVAHEVGHNLGAKHTHCETPPLDMCFNGEGGCYSGAESCPGGGGTIMSYCHLLGGCSASAHFHPFQQSYLNTNITNAISACVFPTVSGAAAPTGIAPAFGPASGGGGVSISGSNFAAGAAVTIGSAATVTGTIPNSITAITAAGNPGRVNVVVTNPGQTGATLSNAYFYHYTDVPPSNGFYPFVNKLLFDGVSSGCGGGNYCPTSSVTRGQMAVFLLRSNGGASYNPPPCTTPTFTDVPCSLNFAPWIDDLAARGVTAGCGGGNYCPNDAVTRDQMAVFLLVTKLGSAYTPPAPTGLFADMPVSNGFTRWAEDLYHRGITGGCATNPLRYCPSNPATRGQMAVFLVTTFGLP